MSSNAIATQATKALVRSAPMSTNVSEAPMIVDKVAQTQSELLIASATLVTMTPMPTDIIVSKLTSVSATSVTQTRPVPITPTRTAVLKTTDTALLLATHPTKQFVTISMNVTLA